MGSFRSEESSVALRFMTRIVLCAGEISTSGYKNSQYGYHNKNQRKKRTGVVGPSDEDDESSESELEQEVQSSGTSG